MTVTVTVNPVNDAPTVDVIADQTVEEDDPATTVLVTGITAGGGVDEDSQTLTVTATSSDLTLLADPSVTLAEVGYDVTFQPVADAVGAATITVTVQDDGGSLSSNVDTVTTTFLVTVTGVNDAPSFDPVDPQVVTEDSGATSVTVTGVSTGGGSDESTQAVTLVATSDDPAVLLDPTVVEAGGVYTLTYHRRQTRTAL